MKFKYIYRNCIFFKYYIFHKFISYIYIYMNVIENKLFKNAIKIYYLVNNLFL